MRCWGAIAVVLLALGVTELRAQAPAPRVAPRTVADLLVGLGAEHANPARFAKQMEVAGQPVPVNAGRSTLLAFYRDRAEANWGLGRIHQAAADLRALTDLLGDDSRQPWVLAPLAGAQLMTGDLSGAAATIEASRTHRWGNEGFTLVACSMLASLRARQGELAEARTLLGQAEAIYAKVSWYSSPNWTRYFPWHRSNIESARGDVLVTEGKWDKAEIAYATAMEQLAEYEKSEPPNAPFVTRGLITSARIENLLNLGRFDEAELIAREWLAATSAGPIVLRVASLVGLVEVMIAKARFEDALSLAEAGLAALERSGLRAADIVSLYVRAALATAKLGREDFNAAADSIGELRAAANADSLLVSVSTFAREHWPLALVQAGRPREALGMLEPLVVKLTENRGTRHYSVGEARGLRAMAYAALGDRARAMQEFADATDIMLSRASLDVEAARQSLGAIVRRYVFESYLRLLAESPAATGPAAAGFRIADALHSATVHEAVVASAVRAAAAAPGLGELVRAEQDGRLETSSLYRILLDLAAAPPAKQLPAVMTAMRERIRKIESERVRLLAEIEARYPAYAHLVNPRPASLEDARAALRPDEALVSIYAAGDRTYVWTVGASGRHMFHSAALGRGEVEQAVAVLRKALDPGTTELALVPAVDVEVGHRLYAVLLAPSRTVWEGARTLVVIAGGALAQIPLSVLPTAPVALTRSQAQLFAEYRSVPWLARKVAVVSVPSVTAFARLRSLAPSRAAREPFVGFGDPAFSLATLAKEGSHAVTLRLRSLAISRIVRQPATATRAIADWTRYAELTPLPDTREELLAIADTLGADRARAVFLGRDASRSKARSAPLGKSRIVAFATHGLIPGDLPGLDQPALALAATENPKESPLLTLEDVLSLKLDADWVVLSACNTAAGDGQGAEALSGLGRAFFYAGTRALLATHWPVETVSARLLTTTLFERYAKDPDISRAQALNGAMLALIDREGEGFSYAHPLFWAPFALVGDGGR